MSPMVTPLRRLFLRTMARTGGRAALWALALLSAGTLAQWLTWISVPSMHCALVLAVGVVVSSTTIAVEVAMVAGPAVALATLREDGSWLGLRSLGARGRDLVAPLALWTVPLAGLALLAGHVVVPAARTWLRDAETEAAVGLTLSPDRATVVGGWALAQTRGGALRFAGQPGGGAVVGEASTFSIEGARGAVRVLLGPGEAHASPSPSDGTLVDAEAGWSLRFASLETALPVATGARVQVGERSTMDLLSRALDPYETWILWKRTLVPFALGLLALLALPLGGIWRTGATVGALGTSFWVLLRVSDAVAEGGSAPLASAVLILPCAIGAVLAWAGWVDR